ncbi:hypothetical protein C8R46DRAFT_1062593 [Mycena filopes]|nr:hypothetical protein C8R46DRAFT_1062593 [Mycena filopes]
MSTLSRRPDSSQILSGPTRPNDDMALCEVDVDVLVDILFLVDVATILAVSRVNRFLNQVASTKHLWTTIVDSVAQRGLIDAPSRETLGTLSTTALMHEVKRGVLGPDTWTPASLDPPSILRQIEVPTTAGNQIEFLAGGRYFLLWEPPRRQVEFWEMHSNRRVASWSRSGWSVSDAVVDLRLGSRAVAVLTIADGHGALSILTVEVDLITGATHEHLELAVSPHLDNICIAGDFIACQCLMDCCILLANWRRAEWMAIKYVHPQELVIPALCAGHIVLVRLQRNFEHQTAGDVLFSTDTVHLYRLRSFTHHWKPATQFDLAVQTEAQGIEHTVLSLRVETCRFTEIIIEESPVCDEVYELHVRTEKSVGLSVQARYKLKLKVSSEPSISQVELNLRSRYEFSIWTSKAGYGLSMTGKTVLLHARTKDGDWKTQRLSVDPGGLVRVWLLPLGGMVVYYTSYAVVKYYA